MWYSTYRESDGALMSHSSKAPPVTPDGLVTISHIIRKDQHYIWNAIAKEWIERPADRVISARDFMARFTPEERGKFYASNSPEAIVLARVLSVLSILGFIDLSHPSVSNLGNSMVRANIITEERKKEIFE